MPKQNERLLQTVSWKVNTHGLLQEVLQNNETGILTIPLRIFAELLDAVARRAIVLNDHELNKLMCRLTLYSIADPTSPDYDPNRRPCSLSFRDRHT